MKRLVDQTHPNGTIEQQAAKLLASVGPTPVEPGLKQRVRKRLLRPQSRRAGVKLPLGLRLPVIAAVLGFAAVSAAAATWYVRVRVPQEPAEVSLPDATEHPIERAAQTLPKRPLPPQELDPAPSVTASAEPAPSTTQTPRVTPPKPKAEPTAEPPTEAGMLFEATKALRHEGNPQKAQRILSEYQRRFPGGAMSEEALALSIEIAQRRGDPRAKQLAERYLKRYPAGHFRSRAERALDADP